MPTWHKVALHPDIQNAKGSVKQCWVNMDQVVGVAEVELGDGSTVRTLRFVDSEEPLYVTDSIADLIGFKVREARRARPA